MSNFYFDDPDDWSDERWDARYDDAYDYQGLYPEDNFVGEPMEGDTWEDAIGNTWVYLFDPDSILGYTWVRQPRRGPVR